MKNKFILKNIKQFPIKVGAWLYLLFVLNACVSSKKFEEMQANYQKKLKTSQANFTDLEKNYEEEHEVLLTLHEKYKAKKVRVQSLQDSLNILASDLALVKNRDEKAVLNLQKSFRQKQDSIKILKKVGQNLQVQIQKLTQTQNYLIAEKNALKQATGLLNDTISNLRFEQAKLKDEKTSLSYLLKWCKEQPFENAFNNAKTVKAYNNEFDTYVVDLEESEFGLFWKDGKGKKYRNIQSLDKDLRKEDKLLIFATNAGMYDPKQNPQGLYVENGQTFKKLDLQGKKRGNFYLKPNGVFLIDTFNRASVVVSEDFKKYQKKTHFATQSGPMLLINGKIHPAFKPNSKNKYIRSGVGVRADGKVVFIISNKPVCFYDFAELFLKEGCQDALYLDGTISKMYLPSLNRFEMGGNFGGMIGVYKKKPSTPKGRKKNPKPKGK